MADAILAQGGIYTIFNTLTGKQYVGQSADLPRRKRSHFGMLRRGNHHCVALQRSFNKHGSAVFEFRILELCAPSQMTEREQSWMDSFRASGIYNMAPAAGSPLGIKRSAETIAKISAIRTGSKASDATRARMSESQSSPRMRLIHSMNGIRSVPTLLSPENRKALLSANTGRTVSAEVREKIAAPQRGKKFSEDHCGKISRAKTGSTHSVGTRLKMKDAHIARKDIAGAKAVEQWARPGMRELLSNAKRGTKASSETKAKLSEISKARWADPVYVARVLEARRLGKISRSAAIVKT